MDLPGAALIQKFGGLPQLGAPDNGVVDKQQAPVLDQLVNGDQLHFAIRFRWLCIVGMNDLGQVGVYLIKGREKGMPLSLA